MTRPFENNPFFLLFFFAYIADDEATVQTYCREAVVLPAVRVKIKNLVTSLIGNPQFLRFSENKPNAQLLSSYFRKFLIIAINRPRPRLVAPLILNRLYFNLVFSPH